MCSTGLLLSFSMSLGHHFYESIYDFFGRKGIIGFLWLLQVEPMQFHRQMLVKQAFCKGAAWFGT